LTLTVLSPKQRHHLGLLVELLPLIFYQHVLSQIYLFNIAVKLVPNLFARLSTHQRCFNFISSYRTPIDMKSVGLVPEFHGLISVQNSILFIFHLGRYIRISGTFRICQHCWHNHLD
jgi:hypothetical protein